MVRLMCHAKATVCSVLLIASAKASSGLSDWHLPITLHYVHFCMLYMLLITALNKMGQNVSGYVLNGLHVVEVPPESSRLDCVVGLA